MMKSNRLVRFIAFIALAALLTGCARQEQAAPTTAAQPVTLVIAGGWPDCRALDVAAKGFSALYPECTIDYEYVQDYYASLKKRMSGSDPVDLFLTTNIQEGSDMLPYALDLYACEGLDLSNAFEGLIQNFEFRGAQGEKARLYAAPLGAEIRGLFVNKTLLKSLDIAVPTNQAELLAACQALKGAGYIPFHGNPGSFAQQLLYPWICDLIANAPDPKAVYRAVNAREAGVSELFREPLSFLYGLVEEGYYDYKAAQTNLGLFLDASDTACARDFLNIRAQGETFVKADDVGQVAFMPGAMSLKDVVAKTKDDYHSEIEYEFILAPIGPEGGFAYLSPAHGIAVCAQSAKRDWAVKFLDYLFQPEHNKTFAEAFNVIPNTREAFKYIRTLFSVPDKRISHLGQVTFDYGFYELMLPAMTDIAKANNPKYMADDGNGHLSLYPLSHFMEELESSFHAS